MKKGASKEFKVSPESFTLAEAGDAGTITVETDTTDKYRAKSFNVTIIEASVKNRGFYRCLLDLPITIKYNGFTVRGQTKFPVPCSIQVR